MDERVGIVAFSFALRRREPNPCNERLADAVTRLRKQHPGALVVTQWEIELSLMCRRKPADYEVSLRKDGGYLDSQGVWNAAKAVFRDAGITRVVVVAQPVFQRFVIAHTMVKRDGFTVVRGKVGWIGFDPSSQNTQPWTRSFPAWFIYLVRLTLGRSHGHGGRQTA